MAKESIYKSLLDCWAPPQVEVEGKATVKPVPIGFITTSFTFDAEFFEEECLTRFLAMETEKENDGAAYLVEREEKLAGLRSGIVLVDQSHCRGSRSLRWHLVPCRVSKGILHAKVTILYWSDCIRLLIGSANLTKPGYLFNQEIYSCMDYYPGTESDLTVINDLLTFIQDLFDNYCGPIVRDSATGFIKDTRSALQQWGITGKQYRKDDVALEALLVSPGKKDGLGRIRQIWDKHFSSPPDSAYITSPFYDTEESAHTPSLKVFDILQQRGYVDVGYNLRAERMPDDPEKYIIHGPSFLKKTFKESQAVSFRMVDETGEDQKNRKVHRPMHFKSIWLVKGDFNLYMIGSGNFTSAALGLGNRVNYEANLVYCLDESRNKKQFNMLNATYPVIEHIDGEGHLFTPIPNEDEPGEQSEQILLPLFFREAVIKKKENQLQLELSFNTDGTKIPGGFSVWYEK